MKKSKKCLSIALCFAVMLSNLGLSSISSYADGLGTTVLEEGSGDTTQDTNTESSNGSGELEQGSLDTEGTEASGDMGTPSPEGGSDASISPEDAPTDEGSVPEENISNSTEDTSAPNEEVKSIEELVNCFLRVSPINRGISLDISLENFSDSDATVDLYFVQSDIAGEIDYSTFIDAISKPFEGITIAGLESDLSKTVEFTDADGNVVEGVFKLSNILNQANEAWGNVSLPSGVSGSFELSMITDNLGDLSVIPVINVQDRQVICNATTVNFGNDTANTFTSTYAEPKVAPYDTRGEIMINMHDYHDPVRPSSGNIYKQVMENEINKGRPFTFQYYMEDYSYYAGDYNNGGARWQNNYYLTPNRSDIKKRNQKGIVAPTLRNGYPVLSNTTTQPGFSLDYLFNGKNSSGVIGQYKDLTNLFYKDADGLYHFSNKNDTILLDFDGKFTHSPGYSSFLPLNLMAGYGKNFWFGMDLSLNFKIPQGNTINGKNMIYNFYGDDDLWVFIDDVLVLDIGGIHPGLWGSIDFTTGKVTEGWIYSETEGLPHEQAILKSGESTTTIQQRFHEAGKTWNNSVGSKHSMKVFYLERGYGGSQCGMEFRLPVESTKNKKTNITASKSWVDNNNSANVRPSQVTVDLYRDNQVISTVNLNAGNGWKHTWSDLLYQEGSKVYTYDVRERTVPGYNGTVKKTGNNDVGWTYTFTNTIAKGKLKLVKTSANSQITQGNGNYSLAGAKYGVYSDRACRNQVATLTTDSGGNASIDINLGTYFVKEISASPGYLLDPNVYEINVTAS